MREQQLCFGRKGRSLLGATPIDIASMAMKLLRDFACEGWQQSEFMRKKCAAGRGAKRPLDTTTMHKPCSRENAGTIRIGARAGPCTRTRKIFIAFTKRQSQLPGGIKLQISTEMTCRLCLMLSFYELSRIPCVETLLPSSLLLLRDLCTWNAAQPSPWTRSRVDDEAQIDL